MDDAEEQRSEDDYETRRDSRSKILRKNLDERGEKRLSDGLRVKEQESGRRSKDDENVRTHDRTVGHDEDHMPASTSREATLDVVRDDKQRQAHDRSPGDAEPNAYVYSGTLQGDKGGKSRRQREFGPGTHEEFEIRDRAVDMVEDGHTRKRDRRSLTPERSERHHREMDACRGYAETDNERSIGFKVKEREENFRDDRFSKGREGSWPDKNRESDSPKDYWKRSQARQDTREGENRYGHHKGRDSQRREQERSDNDKFYSHSGYRRDARGRSEGRSSTSYRNANETDSIVIKPNMDFNFGKEEPVCTFAGRRNEVGSRQHCSREVGNEEWGYPSEERSKTTSGHADDLQERYHDDGSPMDQHSGINSLDSQSEKGIEPKSMINSTHSGTGPSSSSSFQPQLGSNQGLSSFSRGSQQGQRGGRSSKGGRGRLNGRDPQCLGIQMPPILGPPFGHLALTPGLMQPLEPNLAHIPMPSNGPGVFVPSFPGPFVWPGPQGGDANLLAAVPPSLPPVPPPGSGGPRFAPNMGSGPNHGMYFNQPIPGRSPPDLGLGFNVMTPASRDAQHDKVPRGWTTSRNSGPSVRGPSRGEQNDYSQNFVDTGARPQNFIRELDQTSVVEDYPKLRELIQRKDEIVAKSSTPPMYFKCDLKEHVLSPEFFGTKFDVILVDPPWEEYVHRAPGVTDTIDCWSFEEIQNLKIEAIADTPSFIFLWVGDGVGLEQGRQCLKKWGFRRCEDICWVKTNRRTPTSALRHDSHTILQHSKEHCLMGIKGTVRRSTDGHIIHANIDTDIIIAEEPADASSTKKPDDMYRIIEHFALGKRRLELFGEDHNIRSGWLTVGKGLSSSNFNTEAYIRTFADKDGKVWQGVGGRNPPPDSPHLVLTTPEIEALRPKSPPPKNHHHQQQQLPTLVT